MDHPEKASPDSVDRKVLDIFTELAGDRANRIDGSTLAETTMDVISSALTERYGVETAQKIALNMADWNWDAAFVVALHLFPERFTREEITAGIDLFLTHAPNHIREACRLTGQYVWADFPYDEEAV